MRVAYAEKKSLSRHQQAQLQVTERLLMASLPTARFGYQDFAGQSSAPVLLVSPKPRLSPECI